MGSQDVACRFERVGHFLRDFLQQVVIQPVAGYGHLLTVDVQLDVVVVRILQEQIFLIRPLRPVERAAYPDVAVLPGSGAIRIIVCPECRLACFPAFCLVIDGGPFSLRLPECVGRLP